MGWATFRAIFSQTHLVTLTVIHSRKESKRTSMATNSALWMRNGLADVPLFN
jgi:hypothetical protein